MSYSLNLRFLVAKTEGTAGTMETLAGSDYNSRIKNPEISPIIEWDDEASKFANGNHGEDEAVSGAQSATISFSVRMGMGDTVSTAPNYGKFLESCGLKGAASSTTGYVWYPRKEYDAKTMTIWVYDVQTGGATPAGLIYKFAGCMGNAIITCDGIGKPWTANFSFTGKLIDIVDITSTSILEGMDFETAHPDKNLNTTLRYAGVQEKVSSWSLDLGNEISPLINQADVTGYDYFQITNRKPRFSCNPIAQSVSTEDILGRMLSGLTGSDPIFVTGMNLTSGTTGLSIYAPKAQQIQANPGNREGIVSWDSTYRFLANGWTGAVGDGAMEEEDTFQLLIGKRT